MLCSVIKGLERDCFALTVRSLIGEVAIHCMVRDPGPCVLLFCQPATAILNEKKASPNTHMSLSLHVVMLAEQVSLF